MVVLIYALGLSGMVLSFLVAARVKVQEINAPVFMAALEKIVAAGNLDRARKLCAAAAVSPFGRIAVEVVEAGARVPLDMGTSVAADSMRAALAQGRERELARLRRQIWLALACAALAAGGMWVASLEGHEGFWLFGPAPVAVFFAFWTWRAVVRATRDTATHGQRLVELFASARPAA